MRIFKHPAIILKMEEFLQQSIALKLKNNILLHIETINLKVQDNGETFTFVVIGAFKCYYM